MIADYHWSMRTTDQPWSAAEQSQQGRDELIRLLVATAADRLETVITIRPDGSRRQRRPWAFLNDRYPLRRYLSVAHLESAVVVAAGPSRLGIDIVDLRPVLADSFAKMWFTSDERHLIGKLPIQLGWAAKEATYKTLCRRSRFVASSLRITQVAGTPESSSGLQMTVEAQASAINRQRRVQIVFRFQSPYAIALATTDRFAQPTQPVWRDCVLANWPSGLPLSDS